MASLAALAAMLLAASPDAPAEAPAPRRYAFAQALERAAARHPSALSAQQDVLRAEALVRQIRAASLPTLTGNATAQFLDADRKQATTTVAAAQALSMNLTVGVPLVAVQRWMNWVHARDNAEVARVSAAEVRRTLLVVTARSYLTVVAQQRTVEVTDRAFRTAQAHYEYAHGRRQGGVGNRLDEVRAEQEVETTRAQAQVARAGLAKAQEALGVLLAEDGPVDAEQEVALADAPPVDEAVKDAPARRTDLKVLQARADAADALVKDGWADFMPTLTGAFVPFYQNPATTTLPTTGWQAQLVLSLPLYDGGLRYGQRDEREALQSQTRLAQEAALRQLGADVRAAVEVLKRADAALQAARRSALLAKETLELANKAYQAGATTNLEVIDAERRARDAETAATVAEDSARQARLDVLVASGRFP